MSEELTLECTLERERISAGNKEQVAHLKVEVRAGEKVTFERRPLNLCLVFDLAKSFYRRESGGIYDKANLIERVILPIISNLQEEDRFSLVTYDSEKALLCIPSTEITSANIRELRIKALEMNIKDSGIGPKIMAFVTKRAKEYTSNLYEGMKLGRLELLRNSDDDIKRLMIFSDSPTTDADKCRDLAQMLLKEGINTTILGLGADFDEELLSDIAEITKGEGQKSGYPAMISENFAEELVRSWRPLLVSNPRLLIILSGEVKLNSAYKFFPELERLEGIGITDKVFTINLDELREYPTQIYLLELNLPPRGAGRYRIAQLELRGNLSPSAKETRRRDEIATEEVIIQYVEADSQEPPDEEVADLIAEVEKFEEGTISSPKICPKCGEENRGNAKFCRKCGQDLDV